MKISSAVPILNAGQQGSDLGLPFDVRPFLEADLNYYLGVKVVTRQDRPASAFSIPQALLGIPDFHEKFGDCFISGLSHYYIFFFFWESSADIERIHRGWTAECDCFRASPQ